MSQNVKAVFSLSVEVSALPDPLLPRVGLRSRLSESAPCAGEPENAVRGLTSESKRWEEDFMTSSPLAEAIYQSAIIRLRHSYGTYE
jgi:hypothetical protein